MFNVKTWMMIELFIFYSLVANATIFLTYIQLRGTFGYKNTHDNKNRWKFDALDYYDIDIEWTSFIFVPIGMAFTAWTVTAKIQRDISDEDYYIAALLMAERMIQLLMMQPFRNQA